MLTKYLIIVESSKAGVAKNTCVGAGLTINWFSSGWSTNIELLWGFLVHPSLPTRFKIKTQRFTWEEYYQDISRSD